MSRVDEIEMAKGALVPTRYREAVDISNRRVTLSFRHGEKSLGVKAHEFARAFLQLPADTEILRVFDDDYMARTVFVLASREFPEVERDSLLRVAEPVFWADEIGGELVRRLTGIDLP